MAVLVAVRIEKVCFSVRSGARGKRISRLSSTKVQSGATLCKQPNAPVNRRVVGSSPTSGANYINQLARPTSGVCSDTGENTKDSPSKLVLLILSIAPRSSFKVKCP